MARGPVPGAGRPVRPVAAERGGHVSRDDEAFDAARPGGDAEAEPTGLGPLRDARTLRPGSSVAVGIVGLVCGLALLVPAILVPPPSWTLISSIALALVLLWLFVDVTWPAIDEVRSRWALELFSGGRKFTAWAVPSDPGRPRYGRQALSIGANRLRGPAAPEVDPGPKRPKIEAQTVAAEIEARREEDRRR